MDTRMYPQGTGTAKPVYVDGVLVEPGLPKQLRIRKTIAEINAGTTLLAAIRGFKYRITDIAIVALGGTTAGATSLDVKGVSGGSAVIILSALIAGLTRSRMLRMGEATNGVILADGASFVAMDANTAITAIKAGSDFSGATHFDFLVDYVVEA